MPSKSYTIDQLLAMRLHQEPGGLKSLTETNPELATIIRGRQINDNGPRRNPRGNKYLGNNHTEPSTSEDEVVFKGNTIRRASAAPTAATAVAPVTHPASSTTTLPAAALGHSHEKEWKYRGRSDSEAISDEPVSAPAGLLVQKNEGFQRFYKAVASPTHVRVTAGGRIVPNNRGSSSPTKRIMDDTAADLNGVQDQPHNPKPASAAQNTIKQVPIGMPQYYPAFPHPYPSIPAYLPMAFGQHIAGSFPIPAAVGGPMIPQHLAADAMKDMRSLAAVDGQADRAFEPKTNGSVLPRPEQFDQSKPFMYNGQWVIPVTPHFPAAIANQFMPAMLGAHPMMGHMPMAAQVANSHLSAPVTGAAHFAAAAAAQTIHPGFTRAVNAPRLDTKAAQTPVALPISSIKPSDITKNQIASFRSSLKYHEDQLQYNRHQIDEKIMQDKVKSLRTHIQQFEALMHTQLQYERKYYPQSGKDGEMEAQPRTTHHAGQGDDHLLCEPEPDTLAVAEEPGGAKSRYVDVAYASNGPALAAYYPGPQTHLAVPSDRAGRAGLPNDAALAPPFQPRRAPPTAAGMNDSDASWGIADHSKGWDKESGSGHLPANGNGYRIFSQASGKSSANSSKIGHVSTSDIPSVTSSREGGAIGVPYLVGTLPKGVDPRTARDVDYVYPRDLTEEETRARHLYWGKAPYFVRQGLPKYDGKHFYPPSSPKDVSRNGPPGSGCKAVEDDLDPFLSMDPVGKGSKTKALSSDDAYLSTKHLRSFRSQLYGDSEDFQKALEEADESCDLYPCHSNSGGSGTEPGSATFRKRCPENTGGIKLWQAMLQKGSTSSAVSSEIAHGYLPQYGGYAAKSLSPSADKMTGHPNRVSSPGKMSDDIDLSDGGALLSLGPDKRGETRYPNGEGSLEEQFRNVVSIDVANRSNFSSSFNL